MDAMKRARQQAISDLVRVHHVRTQQEVVSALRDKGFRATQATVSRDIAEMGLVKVNRGGVSSYALPISDGSNEQRGEQRLGELLRDLPIDIRESGTLLVIRAVPGTAHAIAAALDRTRWPELLGTIAGDDTIFVACTDGKSLRRMKRRLLGLTSG